MHHGWSDRDNYRDSVYVLNELNRPENVLSTEADRAVWDRLRRSVVRVERLDCPQPGAGTGFVVRSDGLVATAYHVVKGHPTVGNLRVRMAPGFYFDAQVVARDRLADIALIKLKGVERPLRPLQIARSDQLTSGAEVYSFGHAGGARGLTMSRGPFSHTDTKPFPPPITTITGKVDNVAKHISDLPVGPGMSGGPSVLGDGKVIGVSTSLVQRRGVSTSAEHLNSLLSAYSNTKLPEGGVLSIRGRALESDGKPISVNVIRARVLNQRSQAIS